MLNPLPVELVRRIVALAHPIPARTPSFNKKLAERHRSLCTIQRVSRAFHIIGREVLWSTVHYRADGTRQLDHLLASEGDEGSLVRELDHEGQVQNSVDLSTLFGKTPGLVRASIRQDPEKGSLDLAALARLENLQQLVLEGQQLKLLVPLDTPCDALVFRSLKHLELHSVILPSVLEPWLFTEKPMPALKTLSVSRCTVGGRGPSFPKLGRDLWQQLERLHVSHDEHEHLDRDLFSTSSKVLAHIDERSGAALLRRLKRADATGGDIDGSFTLGATSLVLSPAGFEVHRYMGSVTGASLAITRLLVENGATRVLFRPRVLRLVEPEESGGLELVEARMELARERIPDLWGQLDKACAEARDGLEVYYLDSEDDVEQWPAWAQTDPVLRGLLCLVEDCDARTREADEAFSELLDGLSAALSGVDWSGIDFSGVDFSGFQGF